MRMHPICAVSALALLAGLTTIAAAQTGGQSQQPGATQQERSQRGQGLQPDQGQTGQGRTQMQDQSQYGQRRGQTQQQNQQMQPGQPGGQAQQNQGAQGTQMGEQQQTGPTGSEREARRVRLSQQQRSTMRQRLEESGALDQARADNIRFRVTVGARVPRDRVHLAQLPDTVIQEVPAWRGYRFFVTRDRMVIVDPRTYHVVSVVDMAQGPTRTARGGEQARLSLTSAQRQEIMSSVDMKSDVRLGIGDVTVGFKVPRNVSLRAFPQRVVQDIPALRPYRYFVFERDVAIVSPRSRSVVEVISE